MIEHKNQNVGNMHPVGFEKMLHQMEITAVKNIEKKKKVGNNIQAHNRR